MKLLDYLKGAIGKLFGKQELTQAIGTNIALSSDMADGISLWAALYSNAPPWASDICRPLNTPAVIASKIAKLVTMESSVTVTGSKRADFLAQQLQPVLDRLRSYTEYAAAKGGVVFKPYISGGGLAVDCIHAERFYPTDFDGSGRITGAAFFSMKTVGTQYYTRVEHHRLQGNGLYTIQNKAFCSSSAGVLGYAVPLTSVDGWAELPEAVTIKNITQPLFSYFRMPFANNLDPTSPLGVSVYARAVGTLRDLDEQYAELIWEFRGGELAVHASEDLFKQDEKDPDRVQLPNGNKRLYRLLDDGVKSSENLFEVFAPAFRDVSLLNGFNAILRQIETQCGLAFGTLSDVQQVEKTATETMHAKQESYTTVSEIQKALQTALSGLLYAMDAWASIGQLAPAGGYEAAYQWDDSIISDKDVKRQQFWQYVVAGKFPFWKYLVDFESYTEAEAQSLAAESTAAAGDPYADA